jgi:uroporphyrinogen III methyltransferase/synthase
MASPPLAGLRVLLTRPESDGADDWFAGLAAAGASPLLYPTVAIVPPESWQPLDEALAKLSEYEWLIFTSQTAVSFVSSRLPDARFPDPMRTRIAAVGPKTAQAVVERGGRVALVPEDNRQEGLARAMAGLPSGTRVLFPFASGGRTHLAEKLRGQGCAVEVVAAYATAARPILPALPAFDVATFASPSALRAFLAKLGPASLDGKILAVIGPTTEQEALAHGLRPVVARKPDLEALILAIAEARQALGDPHVLS